MICPRDQRGLKIKAGICTKGPGETAPESEEKVRNCGREMRTRRCSRQSAESTRCGSGRSQQGLGAGALSCPQPGQGCLGGRSLPPPPPRGSAARGLSPSSSLNEGRGPGVGTPRDRHACRRGFRLPPGTQDLPTAALTAQTCHVLTCLPGSPRCLASGWNRVSIARTLRAVAGCVLCADMTEQGQPRGLTGGSPSARPEHGSWDSGSRAALRRLAPPVSRGEYRVFRNRGALGHSGVRGGKSQMAGGRDRALGQLHSVLAQPQGMKCHPPSTGLRQVVQEPGSPSLRPPICASSQARTFPGGPLHHHGHQRGSRPRPGPRPPALRGVPDCSSSF